MRVETRYFLVKKQFVQNKEDKLLYQIFFKKPLKENE